MVEIAIVLVIIAIIVGGVLGASNLQRQARYKNVITEMEENLTAHNTFMNMYKYRPGDIPNNIAQRFFSGNGVMGGQGDGDAYWNTWQERDLAWIQLGTDQSGLLKHRITEAPTNNVSMPGVNRPASRVEGAGWTFVNTFVVNGVTFNSMLRLGGVGPDDNLTTPVLDMNAHHFIEGKIDTPNTPLSGKYVVAEAACVNGTVYQSANPDMLCTANFDLK